MRLPIVASPFAPPAAVSAYASHVFAAAARGEPFTFPVAPEVAVSVIYVRDVTLGILRLVEAPEEPLTRRVYNLHGFAASAGDLAQAAAQRVPGFQYRFEPAELPTRILSVQPSVYTDASARRDWGWHPQFDLPRRGCSIGCGRPSTATCFPPPRNRCRRPSISDACATSSQRPIPKPVSALSFPISLNTSHPGGVDQRI